MSERQEASRFSGPVQAVSCSRWVVELASQTSATDGSSTKAEIQSSITQLVEYATEIHDLQTSFQAIVMQIFGCWHQLGSSINLPCWLERNYNQPDLPDPVNEAVGQSLAIRSAANCLWVDNVGSVDLGKWFSLKDFRLIRLSGALFRHLAIYQNPTTGLRRSGSNRKERRSRWWPQKASECRLRLHQTMM